MAGNNINNNLIINYLPQFLTDDEYRNMFLSIGPVKSWKIVRDKTTGFSYGFGFVEYNSDSDAERAVKVYDGLHLYGKRIRVQHANKSDENTKSHNIYVKNIPSDFTEKDLDGIFEPFGKIVTSKVLVDLQTGQSRNIGFVLFESKSEADKAISEMNGKKLPGSENGLYVKYADDSSKKSSKSITPVIPQVLQQPPPASFSLPVTPPVNGLPPPVGQTGPVRNQQTGRNRFNPIARSNTSNDYSSPNNFNSNASNFNNSNAPNFNNSNPPNFNSNPPNFNSNPPPNFNSNPPNFNSNQQNNNMQNKNSNFFGGLQNTNNSNSSNMSSNNVDIPTGPGPFSLFVFNIGDDAEDRELWALFSPFGTVQKCTVMMDHEKKVCKGFGFVDMANGVEAANAIKSLNGFFYKGRQLNVSFKSKRH